MGRLKPSLGRRESVKDREWPVRGGGGIGADVRAAGSILGCAATSKSAGGLESSDDDEDEDDLTGEGDFLGERAR
jgi:hypothetical protein